MINLSFNSISQLEVISLINISNISSHTLYYGSSNCLEKYNPRVIVNALNVAASRWDYDTKMDSSTPTQWPESLEKITLPDTWNS